MQIPNRELSAEEILAYWQNAESALKTWDAVKSSTNAPELAAYRETLSDARHGIETILDVLETKQSDLKRKVGAVKHLLKDLDRHDDLSKDRFWAIKRP